MAIEFDVPDDISIVGRYIDGNCQIIYSTDAHDFDYFDDTIHDGDILYFFNSGYPGSNSHFRKFSGLLFDIETTVNADYTYVWEYYTSDGWKPLPNVVDNTNGLRNAGQNSVRWDMPEDWKTCYRVCGNNYYASGYGVRLRVVSVNSSTEGGRQGSNLVQAYNYALTIRDGNTYDLDDLYNASISNGWGVVQRYSDLLYVLTSNLVITNGQLTVNPQEVLMLGDKGSEKWRDLTLWSGGTLYLNGGTLELMTDIDYGPYNTFSGGLRMDSGATFRKRKGGYVSTTFSGLVEVEDALFDSYYSSDTIMFVRASNGYIRRSNYTIRYLYLYTRNIVLDDLRFSSAISHGETIHSGSAYKYSMIGNSTLDAYLVSTQGSDFYVVDCAFDDDKVIIGDTTYNSYSNYLWRKFTTKIKVVDEEGNPIEGATVYLWNKDGHTALERNWLDTDGFYYDGITTQTDDAGTVLPYIPEWFSAGKVFRIRGEYIKIREVVGSIFYFDRAQTYKGYESLGIGRVNRSPVIEELDYMTTDSNGEVKFHGTQGDFWPLVYTDVWSKSYDQTVRNRLGLNPFTLKVEKKGYETYQTKFNITGPTEVLVVLGKSQSIGILDFKDVIYHVGADEKKPIWIKI